MADSYVSPSGFRVISSLLFKSKVFLKLFKNFFSSFCFFVPACLVASSVFFFCFYCFKHLCLANVYVLASFFLKPCSPLFPPLIAFDFKNYSVILTYICVQWHIYVYQVVADGTAGGSRGGANRYYIFHFDHRASLSSICDLALRRAVVAA